VLLAAAAEQGLPGVGLLGEMPAIAPQLPYPSASAAVLRTFSAMAGMTLQLDELERYGSQMQEQLYAAYQQALKVLRDLSAESSESEAPKTEPSEEASNQPPPPPSGMLSETDRARIEELFVEAAKDRVKAFELKTRLDHLGVFRQYEDRFLALFKDT
ncbi:MAG: PAC2 family protein, partial [Elusimicrobia bacterium]|nr:PAC2 family protein [Elusimicrobiota bacterium]